MDKYIKYEDIREFRFFQDEEGEWILHADIIKIPAADVMPMRHGQWENTGSDVWKCSACGYGIMPWNAGVNYCPNCGANMRDNTQKTSVDEEVKHG